MKRFKIYVWSAVILVLLSVAGAGIYFYANGANDAPVLWGLDDTVMHTVAVSSKRMRPTRESPVFIEAQVERLYGLHIGTPVKVRYKIVSQNSVAVRFDTLMRGVISRRASPWRMAGKAKVISTISDNGFTTRVVEVVVAVWESPVMPEPPLPQDVPPEAVTASINGSPKPAAVPVWPLPVTPEPPFAQVVPVSVNGVPKPVVGPELWPFSVEILASTEKLENGSAKWDYITTPEVKFGFASLLEPGASQLDYGPTGRVADYDNRVGVALYDFGIASGASGVIYLLFLMSSYLQQWRKPMVTPASVQVYRQAVAEAETARLTKSHLEQVRVAVREFLGGATLTNDQLLLRFVEHPLFERIADMLGILDDAVGLGRLSGYEEECVTKVMDLLLLEQINKEVHPDVIAKLSIWFKLRSRKFVRKWRKR
ncbi:MAG: hypothetical protein P4L53_03805 [Candidatus Obscuribacterales bacterium]|nr:hypothetical protein [Candidatus Obscuribacterales bacterium]